jgi:chemotaxis protein methyltransferase CheR
VAREKRREIVPTLLAGRKPHTGHLLKIWSAASSIGGEAYSIAMLLADMADTFTPSFRFAILGTDILHRGAGPGGARRLSGGDDPPGSPGYADALSMRSRTAAGRAEVRIVPELRRVCRFVRLNLMDERPCRGGAPRLPLHARI